jgi:glutathione S-transferase
LVPKLTPVIARMLIRHYGVAGMARKAAPKLAGAVDLVAEATAHGGYLVGDTLTLADIGVATAARPLDTLREIRNDPAYERFFEWRDGILAQCFIH